MTARQPQIECWWDSGRPLASRVPPDDPRNRSQEDEAFALKEEDAP